MALLIDGVLIAGVVAARGCARIVVLGASRSIALYAARMDRLNVYAGRFGIVTLVVAVFIAIGAGLTSSIN